MSRRQDIGMRRRAGSAHAKPSGSLSNWLRHAPN